LFLFICLLNFQKKGFSDVDLKKTIYFAIKRLKYPYQKPGNSRKQFGCVSNINTNIFPRPFFKNQ